DVLDLLARDFAAGGYDLRRLVHVIVRSRAYQLSAGGDGADAGLRHRELQHFARFPTPPPSVGQPPESAAPATRFRGTDAAAPQEPDAEGYDGFTDYPVTFLGERPLTVQRALTLLNGDYVQQAVQAGAQAAVQAHGEQVGPAHVEALFLATLSRRP